MLRPVTAPDASRRRVRVAAVTSDVSVRRVTPLRNSPLCMHDTLAVGPSSVPPLSIPPHAASATLPSLCGCLNCGSGMISTEQLASCRPRAESSTS